MAKDDLINVVFPEAEEIAKRLLVYQVFDENGLVPLRRIGREMDGGYVIPELAIQKADVILGFGICEDISFEDSASQIYQKKAFGFDSANHSPPIQSPLCTFIPKIIAGQELIKNVKTKTILSFDQVLSFLNIERKKLFIKMDIEENEFAVFPDMMPYFPQITGITFELHMTPINTKCALKLLQILQNDFRLVHINGIDLFQECFTASNVRGNIPLVLELSYINHSLLRRFQVAPNQSHPTPLDQPCGPWYSAIPFEIIPDPQNPLPEYCEVDLSDLKNYGLVYPDHESQHTWRPM